MARVTEKQIESRANVAVPPRGGSRTDRARLAGQENKILELLTEAGSRGCTNSELWSVCHAVNSRVSDLRRAGHDIEARPEGGGVWRYRLIATPQSGELSRFEQQRRNEFQRDFPLFAEARHA